MPLELQYDPPTNVLTVKMSGKLQTGDYDTLTPYVEELMREHDKVDMLVILHDFHGWTAGALWGDVKFDAKHFRDIGKLAIVGETKWEQGMATFCKPSPAHRIIMRPHSIRIKLRSANGNSSVSL